MLTWQDLHNKGMLLVRTISLATGYDWDLQAWNMLVAPKGLDKEAQDKLTAAMKKVYASGELAEFANKQGFEVIELYGDDATQFMANEDKKFGEIIKK
ncbi:MAG: tripartite tricarboxylate transporter substrate-binding protein [Proteus mirabilis]